MARTVPTKEPVQLRAGDTWEWTRTLADYPASTWTLTYTFFNPSALFTVVASADGDTHSIDVAPATTAARTAGRYDWTAGVSDGTDVYQIGSGVLQVLPDLSSETSYDGRSHPRKMLDLLNAVLEGRASSDQIAVIRADMNGRGVQYDMGQVRKMRQECAASVKQEDDALRIARGEKSGRFIATRFRA